ncbi:Bacteroides conjugative transposon TraM protein [Mucilaginibacter pineti]|uniref:Bacteroides conjugative transposon TraM protein n=1 Tax=Mucilaginibacter pineti TaxID=1391627 RepID=A0A1G7GK87_9SPHI|nr:conjugative transposon protein TraM [Mucilaginibacter pineti]SDE88473.1 Bacteroides conjugative transposon TraM protein [Mucilaginibacter pineti]
MNTQTLKQKHRRMLLVLPILVLPFVTFAFWALGGGKGDATAKTTNEKGLNLELPDAHNSAGPMDKMSYYDLATADSLKLKEQSKNDPYYHGQQQMDEKRKGDSMSGLSMGPSQPYPDNINNGASYHDPNEARVYEKLGQLNRVMQQSPQSGPYQGYNTPYQAPQASMNTADVDRLEKMMQTMQNHDTGDDPETKQLSGMLEKILDIQHPERVKEKIKQSEDQRNGQVYAVKTATKNGRISLIDNSAEKIKQSESDNSSGFYGLNDTISEDDEQNAIEAVVHENQTLVSGSIVKLRLLDDINVRGTVIPKNNFVYGTVSLDGERLTVKIKGLRYRKSLYPVQLSVYDIDGLDGIYIPGAIARDVAKSSAERSIQSIGLTSFDQTLGAQAAGAGIEAAKSFLSKKIKLIKVMVKAGYKVLLRDDKQKE